MAVVSEEAREQAAPEGGFQPLQLIFEWFRRDLGEVRAEVRELRREMKALESGLREEIGGLRQEVKEEIGGLRQEVKAVETGLRQEMSGLRQEMKVLEAGLRQEMKEETRALKGHFWAAVGVLAAVYALISAFVR